MVSCHVLGLRNDLQVRRVYARLVLARVVNHQAAWKVRNLFALTLDNGVLLWYY